VVSTGDEASVCIDMKELKEAEEIDISQWNKAPMAQKFRSTIRKAERWLKAQEDSTPDSIELEEMLIALKEAIILNREQEELEDIEAEVLELLD